MGACASVPKAMRDEGDAPAPEPLKEVVEAVTAGEVSEEKVNDEGANKNKDEKSVEGEATAAEKVSEEKVDGDKSKDEVEASKEEATQASEEKKLDGSVVEEKKTEDKNPLSAILDNLIGHFNH